MADHSLIEWTDATWNPITGCSVVSPGCTNCYAMKLAGTRLKHIPSRAGLTRDSKAGPVWTGEVRLNEQWLDQPLRWTKPRRIFVCAHGDLFAENVPDEWIDRVFAVMALAPQHTFQVLTKRPARMRTYIKGHQSKIPYLGRMPLERIHLEAADHMEGDGGYMDTLKSHGGNIYSLYCSVPWPLPNVWLGVSTEDQARADERIPDLLATPAAVRFVSAEPLLGPIDTLLTTERGDLDALRGLGVHADEEGPDDWYRTAMLDWVIVGGESGQGARPMHPQWVRSLRDQCAAAGTAFFFKQWGEWAPNIGAVDGWTIDDSPEISRFDHREWEDGRWSEPFRPMWCDFSDGNYDEEQCVSRIGKKRAGRLLDSVEHNAMPEVA